MFIEHVWKLDYMILVDYTWVDASKLHTPRKVKMSLNYSEINAAKTGLNTFQKYFQIKLLHYSLGCQ